MQNPRKAIRLVAILFALLFEITPSFAETDDAADSRIRDSLAQKHGRNLGIYFEHPHLSADDLTSEMKMAGRRYDVKADVSNLVGLSGQYTLNEWISLFSLLAYQHYDIDYADRDTTEGYRLVADKIAYPLDSIDVKGGFSLSNIILEVGLEAGFAFVQTENMAVRAIVSFGPLVGFTNLDGSLFGNSPIYGYARGLSLQFIYKKLSLTTGVRTTHFYWRTYFNNRDAKGKDNTWMMDFDTKAAPFFVIGFSL